MNVETAAKRLCHLSMRYVGAFLEATTGKQVGLIPQGHPGLSETRDLINLILLTRAEINGITKVLVEKGITTGEELSKILGEEYEWFAQEKAKYLNVEVTDFGLVFKNPNVKD